MVDAQEPFSLDTPIERLLTVEDVARILGVSRAAVYAMVSRGDLTPVPLPLRKTRFARDTIERLLRGEIA
jgi:excisionase family DNA binding protein